MKISSAKDAVLTLLQQERDVNLELLERLETILARGNYDKALQILGERLQHKFSFVKVVVDYNLKATQEQIKDFHPYLAGEKIFIERFHEGMKQRFEAMYGKHAK